MSLAIKNFYRFGEYVIDSHQRVLRRDGEPVILTLKAFDLLLTLVEHSGQIITKAELMERLWPDTFVEEANLTSQIQQLRKALGDNARQPIYIETVTRRGYRFIAPVEEVLNEVPGLNEQITWRIEASNGQALEQRVPSPRRTPEGEIAVQEVTAQAGEPPQCGLSAEEVQSPSLISEVSHQQNTPSETAAGAPAASHQPTTPSSKKRVTSLVALLIVLVGVGLLATVYFVLSGNQSPATAKGDKSRQPSPLRVEKLTRTGQCKHAAISPDGKYLAYARGEVYNQSVWLRQLGTNTNIEIIPTKERVFDLAFSNSGEHIYVVKGQPTALYRVSVLGGVLTKVVSDIQGHFSLSADDEQVAFIRDRTNDSGLREYSLMVAGTDGTGERPVLVRTYPEKLDVPLWSSDGRSILYAEGNSDGGGRDVKIMQVDVTDGAEKEVVGERFYNVTKMAWAPNQGSLIVAAALGVENTRLWRVSYPSSEVIPIAEDVNSYNDLSIAAQADVTVVSQTTLQSFLWADAEHNQSGMKKLTPALDRFCWTPGGQVVFTSAAGGAAMDLWVMNPDGTGQTQLTANAQYNSTPVATPDGRYIVFMSNRTGSFQVWRMDGDGGNQIQLTEGGGKNHPAVSRDGRWVLYNTTEDWRLWKVPIGGGQPVQLTDYVAVLPSVSPDGRRIACISRTGEKRELLIIPFEGGSPLKRIPYTAWGNRLQWTPDGTALLYEASIHGVSVIVKQSINGGTPEKVVDVGEGEIFDFGYSPDSKTLALTRGSWQHDIMLISGLN